MGDVVEMKREVKVQVNRFGHLFGLAYRAGRTPALSDPQAAVYLDGKFFAWAAVAFHMDRWSEIFVDLDEETILVSPEMLGITASSEDEADQRFILDTEEYVMRLLNEALAAALNKGSDPEVDEGASEPVPDPRNLHPRTRGLRAVEVWHNHGKDEEQLPDLIAIEVYDAIEGMGLSLAEALDEIDDSVPREECGNLVRALVEDTLQAWHRGEE